jgi:hypothetical protein
MLIMLKIIFLQLTQNSYFEQILSITTSNKITYCIDLLKQNTKKAIDFDYEYYKIEEDQDYFLFPPNSKNKFIFLLNFTISNCFII